MNEPGKSLDIFGVKPVADSVSTVVTAATAGASAFLGRICLPAAEEFGLLLRDKVSGWRASNVAAISKCAEATLNEATNASDLHAHPRLVGAIIEHGSWADDGTLQNMWGGLLASYARQTGATIAI